MADREDPADRSTLPALVVSACLLGVACTHRDDARRAAPVEDLADRFRLIAVCPEVAGGLTNPRPEAELQPDGSVVTSDGTDASDAYRRGADQAVAIARVAGVAGAVLKARSPSCGIHQVYDGTFSRTLRPGEGVTAAALRAAGFALCSEEDVAAGSGPLVSDPDREGATRLP